MAILLVDDDISMQRLAAIFLERHGFPAIITNNTAHALEILGTITPQAVVLDIMMPGINGIDLCRMLRVRKDTARIPVIILTSLNDPEVKQSCLDAGADLFLNKYDLPRLPDFLKGLLNNPTLMETKPSTQYRARDSA